MKKNNEALRQEIAKRAGILSGLAAYNGVNAVAPVTISSESSTTPILSKNQLALKDSEKATLQGPYLINTACFTGKEQSSLLYIATRVEINGHAFNLPKLATDNFYQKLNPKLPNEKRLIDAGYPWHYVSEGNTYRCNELEYQPRLFTIQLFIDKYKENPLLPTILSSNYVQTLSQADQNELKNISNQEAKFLAGKNIGDKELSDLTNGYLETYKTLKKLSDTSDSKLKDQNEALNRFLYLRDRQAALSELFNSSLSLGDLNYRFQQGFLKSNSTFNDYLYLGRSAYALTYLNFSPSVWRIAEKPNYINSALSRVDNSGTPYATFTELLKKYTAAQIVSWHKIDELDIIRPLGN